MGAFSSGLFHVMTHAFFKGLLFLGAGSVIHAMHEEQDMRRMGGLRNHIHGTYETMLLATIAIAGIPPFAGFWSKDEILGAAVKSGGLGVLWWLMGLSAAFMTSFYMFRLIFLTFYGQERFDTQHVHPHESPPTMLTPLKILALTLRHRRHRGGPATGEWAVPCVSVVCLSAWCRHTTQRFISGPMCP